MSGIKLRSRPAPATKRAIVDPEGAPAIIVAHGSPSNPEILNNVVVELARRVQQCGPGCRVLGATLALRSSLEQTLLALPKQKKIFIFPLFMSDGWFVSQELPRRVNALGYRALRLLSPLGLEPSLPSLCTRRAREAALAMGIDERSTTVLLAAHGSPNDPGPELAAQAIQQAIIDMSNFLDVKLAFIDQSPKIQDVVRGIGPVICLPLFACRAGHVRKDLPKMLATGGFRGSLLAPIGEDPLIANIISARLRRQGGPRTSVLH